jgi:hypothetical protein
MTEIVVPVTVEAAIGADLTANPATWTWTSLSSRLQGIVTITRGRADQFSQTQPTKGTLRLGNTDGWLTPRHPLSPWYMLWGLGTPMRVSAVPSGVSHLRGQGRVISILPVWPSGNSDVAMVDVVFAGALYHLDKVEALHSPLYRVITADGPIAYWPGEDGSQSQYVAEALGNAPMVYTDGPPSFGSSGPAGTASVITMASSSRLHGTVKMSAAATAWSVETYLNVPSVPPLAGNCALEWDCARGTVRQWRLSVFVGGGLDQIGIEGWDSTGTQLINFRTDFTFDGLTEAYGIDMLVTTAARQNGGNIEYEFGFASASHSGGLAGGSIAGTLNAIVRVDTPFVNDGWKYGHVSVWDRSIDASWGTLAFSHAAYLKGLAGQTATARIVEVAAAAGMTASLRSGTASTGVSAMMGALPIDQPLRILRECEDADLGILTDGFNAGVDYLSKTQRFNQAVAMALDTNSAQIKLPFEPVEDDQRLSTVETVSRNQGSTATAESPLATTVGRYSSPTTLNLLDDTELGDQAAFRLSIATVPEMRLPTSTIDLRDTPELIPFWLACDIGSRYTMSGLMTQYPPGVLDQEIEQYVETLGYTMWQVVLVGSAYAPWRAFTVADTVLGRLDTGGSTLAVAATAKSKGAADSLRVFTNVGPQWTTNPARWPFDINIAGEQITVTSLVAYLNANPYFETTASPWTNLNNSTIARSNTQAHEGSWSLKITPDGVTAVPGALAEEVPVTVGRNYTLSGWLWSTSAATRRLGISWYDASHVFLSNSLISTALGATTWTQMGPSVFTAPASAAFARVVSSDPGTPAAANPWYVDEATIVDPVAQTFTVTRAVNGVVKAQVAGAAVNIWKAPVIAL